MNKDKFTTVERIIAKIDNDFNPNNTEWVARVPAWCIDAMSQINVLMESRQKKKLEVKDRVAMSDCCLTNLNNLKVYDENGCEIPLAGTRSCCGNANNSSTGKEEKSPTSDFRVHHMRTHRTVELEADPTKYVREIIDARATQYNQPGYPARYNVVEINGTNRPSRNYVISGGYSLELNYDAEYVTIEYDGIETMKNDNGIEYPVIPNNGVLIEAIVYYCMYKMLCRGYKHPVLNLQASQYGTNPYYIWTQMKDEAERSVINNGVDEDVSKLFRSSFFINTFQPRN